MVHESCCGGNCLTIGPLRISLEILFVLDLMQDFRAVVHGPNMLTFSGMYLANIVYFVAMGEVFFGDRGAGIVRIENRVRRQEQCVGNDSTTSGHYLGLVWNPSNLNTPYGIE